MDSRDSQLSVGRVARRQLLNFFISNLFLALLLLSVSFGVHFFSERQASRATALSSESLNVDLAERALVWEMRAVTSDLLFLASQVDAIQRHLNSRWQQQQAVTELFRNFSEQKGLYDQIRLLDLHGQERVRVNFNAAGAELVSEKDLQNKADRYYFIESQGLAAGQVYISPFDLNVEQGQLEQPYQPVLRFVTPLFDVAGKRQGSLVLNYFGEKLIDHFRHAASNIADHVHLLNRDGYWLSSPRPADEWGFALNTQRRFSNDHPQAWSRIKDGQNGQFELADGLYTYATLAVFSSALQGVEAAMGSEFSPLLAANPGDKVWKIAATLPAKAYIMGPLQFFQRYYIVYGSMLLLVLIGAYILARARLHQQWAANQGQYERRFRRTLETIELAAVSLDRQGRVVFANEYFQRLCGRSAAEINGLDWMQTFVPDARQQEMMAIIEHLNTPHSFPRRVEMPLKLSNGESRLVAWHNTLSFDEHGQVSYLTAIGEDITERRHMEEELHKLFRAVEQSASVIMITNRDGLIEYVNRKFYEVTGYTATEIIGARPSILSSGEKSPEEYRELWQTISAGGEWRGEFHNRRKNGELYWEAASISAIRGVSGEISHFLAVKEDITERKRLQQTIDERNRELARAQVLATIGRMASMIAHDLRNPISSLKMGWQILARRFNEDPEVQELGEIARDQIFFMENILSSMLTYARPEAVKLEWLNPLNLLRETLNSMKKQLDENHIQLIETVTEGLPTFPGDAYKLRQVISNLISNAIHASLDNAADDRSIAIDVSLEFGIEGTMIRYSICDNGCGIDAARTHLLFEPFYTTRARGTGLGLSIVRRIVEQHRGGIWLHPGKLRGTCAELTLPTVPAQDGELIEGSSQANGQNTNH